MDVWPMMDSNNLYFPSLKIAKIRCRRAAGDAFAETISYPELLTKLDISFTYQEYNISPRFFQSFARVFNLSVKLTEVRLDFAMYPVSWTQLRSLLHCRNLVDLTISTLNPITGFNDDSVNDLASSLSNLEALRLIPHGTQVSPTQVTLLGLVYLAQFTPRLRKLSLRITTRIPNPGIVDALLQFQPPTPHSINELDLCSSELNVDDDTPEFMGARRTAGVLTSIWPSLEPSRLWFGWRSSIEPEPTMNKAWAGVHRYMEQREQDGAPISFI